MQIGLTRMELIDLITRRVVEIAGSIDHEIPPRSPDIYSWVENLFGHNGRVYSQVIVDAIEENNRRISEQISSALQLKP
jgi:hypothetical protein